jgi:hypothetical protein
MHRDKNRDDSYLYPFGKKDNLNDRLRKSTIIELQDRITSLEERLDNLVPTEEQLAKYPSLRDAYEQFFIIKRLTLENGKT